jgi:syntaxin 6
LDASQLKDGRKLLKRHLKNAELTLQDIDTTVQLVASDREKFRQVNEGELMDRRNFVVTCKNRLERVKLDMNSESVKAKLLADERSRAIRLGGMNAIGEGKFAGSVDTSRRRSDVSNARLNDGNALADESNTQDSHVRTSLLLQQQDETLDILDAAVTRVGNMAGAIHEEIGHQNKMLSEIDEDLTNAEQELGVVMGKLGKFLKTKDRWQLGTIMALSATVVILFFLVLYT